MIVVEIYSKPDCSLCDRAKIKLNELRKRHTFELREILLDETHPRYEEFSNRVPVTVINNDITFEYRIPEEEFLRHLISLSRTSA